MENLKKNRHKPLIYTLSEVVLFFTSILVGMEHQEYSFYTHEGATHTPIPYYETEDDPPPLKKCKREDHTHFKTYHAFFSDIKKKHSCIIESTKIFSCPLKECTYNSRRAAGIVHHFIQDHTNSILCGCKNIVGHDEYEQHKKNCSMPPIQERPVPIKFLYDRIGWDIFNKKKLAAVIFQRTSQSTSLDLKKLFLQESHNGRNYIAADKPYINAAALYQLVNTTIPDRYYRNAFMLFIFSHFRDCLSFASLRQASQHHHFSKLRDSSLVQKKPALWIMHHYSLAQTQNKETNDAFHPCPCHPEQSPKTYSALYSHIQRHHIVMRENKAWYRCFLYENKNELCEHVAENPAKIIYHALSHAPFILCSCNTIVPHEKLSYHQERCSKLPSKDPCTFKDFACPLDTSILTTYEGFLCHIGNYHSTVLDNKKIYHCLFKECSFVGKKPTKIMYHLAYENEHNALRICSCGTIVSLEGYESHQQECNRPLMKELG